MAALTRACRAGSWLGKPGRKRHGPATGSDGHGGNVDSTPMAGPG